MPFFFLMAELITIMFQYLKIEICFIGKKERLLTGTYYSDGLSLKICAYRMLNGKWEIPMMLYNLKSTPEAHVNYREPNSDSSVPLNQNMNQRPEDVEVYDYRFIFPHIKIWHLLRTVCLRIVPASCKSSLLRNPTEQQVSKEAKWTAF